MTRRRSAGRVSDALELFPPEPPAPVESRAPRAPTRRPTAREGSPEADASVEAMARAALDAGTLQVDPYARPRPEPVDDLPRHARAPGETPGSAVSVSTLTQTAKDLLEGAFVPLWIRGEVTGFKAHRNGHWYFTLRDQLAQVSCVMWGRDAARLPAMPDEGMQVTALGQVSVYAARGQLQVVVRDLQAQGDGLWRKALEATRRKLDAEGLLDPLRKRALPRYPRRVAVVTSPDGAALHDIVAVVRRRCPWVEIVVVAAKVQGDGAAEELCAAVQRVGRWQAVDAVDVVIIGRGGGGREDLWAFNDERLARAVAACPVPVVSAVGHEIDVTICDLVADLRAPTPSAAAESVVPVLAELRDDVAALGAALQGAMEWQLGYAEERLAGTARALTSAATRLTERRRAAIETAAGRLHALSPLATLGRGYAVARGADGSALGRVGHFVPGQAFTLQVRDGRVRATVDAVDAAGEPAVRDGVAAGSPAV